MSLNAKEFTGASFGAIIGKTFSLVSSFVFFAVIGNALDAKHLGEFLLFFNVVGICAVVSQVGMNQIAVRVVQSGETERDQINGKIAGGALLSIFSCVLLSFFAMFYMNSQIDITAATATLFSVWMILAVIQLYFVGLFRAVKSTFWSSMMTGGLTHIIFLILYLCLVWFGRLSFYSFGVCYVIALAVAVTFVFPGLYERYKNFGRIDHVSIDKKYVKAGAALMFVAAINAVSDQGDIVFLTQFFSPEELSIYGIAQKIVRFIIFPLVLFNILLPPFVVQLYGRGDTAGLERLLRSIATPAFIVCVFICMLVYMYPGYFVGLFLKGEPSPENINIILMFSAAQTINVLTGFGVILMSMTAHQTILLKVAASMLAGKYISFWIMSGQYGLEYYALVSSLFVVFQNLLLYYFCAKVIKVNTMANLNFIKVFFDLKELFFSKK